MAGKSFAQTLRHRVDIQSLTITQDPDTGAQTEVWASILSGEESVYLVPASVLSIPGRATKEFVQSNKDVAGVNSEILMRYRADMRPSMRLVHEAQNYNIRAVLPDPTQRQFVTVLCETGLNDG